MTSGIRYLLKEAFGWVFIVVLSAFVLANFHELKVVTAKVLGLPPPTDWQDVPGASQARTAVHGNDDNAQGQVRLRRDRRGHYRAKAELNNRRIDLLVDTGATYVALTYEDARRAGIFVSASDFTARTQTANGHARYAPIMISSIRVGDITLRNVRGSVSQRGALHISLLGMSFLGRLSRVEMRKGDLLLEQ